MEPLKPKYHTIASHGYQNIAKKKEMTFIQFYKDDRGV